VQKKSMRFSLEKKGHLLGKNKAGLGGVGGRHDAKVRQRLSKADAKCKNSRREKKPGKGLSFVPGRKKKNGCLYTTTDEGELEEKSHSSN